MEDILQVLQTSWPILLMVVIFYFLLWRPQKKQQKERANLLGSLKKVKVQVSEKVELTFARSAIANVLSKKNKEEK